MNGKLITIVVFITMLLVFQAANDQDLGKYRGGSHDGFSLGASPPRYLGEGFDCDSLTTLFLVTPIRFSGRVIQYLGRILRPAPGKKEPRVFDYVDVHVDVLRAAATSRQKVYGMK